MTVTLDPLRTNVLVRLRPVAAQTGRIVRVAHFEPARKADVLAVGPECRDIQVGMGVLVNPLVGQAVGDDELLQPESSVLATLEAGE